MNAPLSVSSLNEQIKNLLESTFMRVYVEGELSRITYHNSGHIYFTLKDASSAISAVMFRGNASKLRFRLEEGLNVVVEGAITLYKPRGSYQINCFMIEPAGHGALALAYEQLKQRLSQMGYFDPAHKKAMPQYPARIALVTSSTGAALQDMQRVAAHRWPLAKLFVFDTLVQGENAAPSIVAALNAADARGFDVIVVGRGGGSIEDLWAFNEEMVAAAVYRMQTPVVSAVGHEIDWVITDFVADLRAPTPSAAMQMILPDQNEMLQTIDALAAQLDGIMAERIRSHGEQLAHLQSSYARHSIEQRLKNAAEVVAQLQQRFSQSMQFVLEGAIRKLVPLEQNLERSMIAVVNGKKAALNNLCGILESNNPKLKSKKGFAQISRGGKVIDLAELKAGERFEAMDDRHKVSAQVLKTEEF